MGTRAPTARDDIPMRPKHTYATASCLLPRVTDTCTVRALGHTTVTATPTADVRTAYNFTLSQCGLINSGQWDQYKIQAIRFTVSPDQNAVGLFTNAAVAYTPMYVVIDYDDATPLGSFTAAEAYSNCIVLGAGESCDRLFKPRMAVAAYAGAFTSFANVGDMWIDAANTTVQHYGVKIVVPGVLAGQTTLPSWQISIEYFIAFRKSI